MTRIEAMVENDLECLSQHEYEVMVIGMRSVGSHLTQLQFIYAGLTKDICRDCIIALEPVSELDFVYANIIVAAVIVLIPITLLLSFLIIKSVRAWKKRVDNEEAETIN